jgi:hypothetical protein
MSVVHVVPAYGRDYATQAAVKAAWRAEQDFLLADPTSRWNGLPVNRQQVGAGDIVIVRYARLRETVQVQP